MTHRHPFPLRPRRTLGQAAALLLLALALPPAMRGGDQPAPPASARRVLFVGNSLTQFNALHEIVTALSRAVGDTPPLVAEAVAFGGYALEDHLAEGTALRRIGEGDWELVALQQGPSSQPDSRALLLRDTRRFAERIRAVGARPALLMAWPTAARQFDAAASAESYRLAAREVRGLLLAGGEALRRAAERDASLPLYGPDRLHPAPVGSYLLAVVARAAILRDRTPAVPTTLVTPQLTIQLSTAQAATLAAVAGELVVKGEPLLARGATNLPQP